MLVLMWIVASAHFTKLHWKVDEKILRDIAKIKKLTHKSPVK